MAVSIGEMSRDDLHRAIAAGGRVVYFPFCVSVLVLSFKRSSGLRLVAAGKSPTVAALPWLTITLLCGWWGIPWGPIWSLQCLFRNLRGGCDVTEQLRAPR